jgi:hypothetical protein
VWLKELGWCLESSCWLLDSASLGESTRGGEDGDTGFLIPDTRKLLTAGEIFCGFLF